MANESLLDTNWSNGDTIVSSELNTHGQEHLDLDGHGDAFHSVQYLKSLSGGDGIGPSNISDGDTVSVNWADADPLTSSGTIGDWSGADDLDVFGAVTDWSGAADLDGSGSITATLISSLTGGTGIDPTNIGDGDTISLTNDSVTVAGNSVSLGGSTGVAHGDLSNAPTSAHHQEPTAGTGLTDEATNQFGIANDGVTDTELGVDSFSYDPGMTEWANGLTNDEVNRIALQFDEQLVIERVEFRQKGGGNSSDASIDIYNPFTASRLAKTTLGQTVKDPGVSGAQETLIIRLTNKTGSKITAAPRVQGYITGV